MLIVAGLIAILLRPKSRLVRGGGDGPSDAFLSRNWWLWYPLAVALPIVLAAGAAAGYTYTVSTLGPRLLLTAYLLPTMMIVRDVVVRGLLLSRRHIVRAEVRKRRETELEAGHEEHTEGDHEFETTILREAIQQVTSVSKQTARLVNYLVLLALLIKVYLIWSDQLPAFQFLYRTDLYTIGDVEVTLADLLAAVLAVAATVVVVRTLPGMLDVYVLSRVRVSDGGRFALTTLVRYVLVAAGIIATCSLLGLTWGSVQWIIAALGVGLGFGLQEIVANFVSGLLILFEQRVRIRDFVTAGETTGRITSIHMWYTAVTDWDGKETVIPNKEFVTSRVVNWTLSQRTIRVVIPVGIAYGSDTRRAQEILVRVGCENEFTLEAPPVRAYFLGFGTSSLDFELRVWLPDMENWVEVRHELHQAIDDAFREAGITIAFPQLDVHWDAPSHVESPSGNSSAEPDEHAEPLRKPETDGV
jgi:potassium efflux system protein